MFYWLSIHYIFGTIQAILGCSDEEARLFISYFSKCELIEKLETGDGYFVVKSNFDGLVVVVRIMIEACVLIEKSNQTNW